MFVSLLPEFYFKWLNNWPIVKPLPSNADEPEAVEYQLHMNWNSDIFRILHQFDGLYATKMEKRCASGICNIDNPNEDENIHFLVVIPSLNLLKQNINCHLVLQQCLSG